MARAPSAGYSRTVRILRVALPLLALGIVATLLIWPSITKRNTAPLPDATPPGQVEMINTRYSGVDRKGRPFRITALSATRDEAAGAVLLEAPEAGITLDSGPLTVKAGRGRLAEVARTLQLDGSVTLGNDAGTELVVPSLSVDLDAGSASGTGPVTATGPGLRLSAAGVTVAPGMERVLFQGPVSLVLWKAKP